MSLLDDALETCVMMDKRTQPDGYGGYISTYTEGAEFKAAIVFDTSMEARAAEKQGVTSLYTVTTTRALTLQYQKVFRVTSDGDDKYTPASTALDMRQVTAESYILE